MEFGDSEPDLAILDTEVEIEHDRNADPGAHGTGKVAGKEGLLDAAKSHWKGGKQTWPSWTQNWTLMRPTTFRSLASFLVQSRMVSKQLSGMVCGGMLQAESPAWACTCSMSRYKIPHTLTCDF